MRTELLVVIIVAASAARFVSLDHRPMHADEAVLADKFGTFLATGRFAYDPRDYHGPMLAWASWMPARLAGQDTHAALTETTLRIAPAVAGVLVALSPLLLIPVIGARASLWAAAFLGFSPAMVYYSRYFIPEMLLALWTALLMIALLRGWWLTAGIAAVLMLLTKETAALSFAAAVGGYFAVLRPKSLEWRAALVVLPPVALAAWNWEAAASYMARATSGLHAHPWPAYLRWLAITEAPLLIAAAFAWRSQKPAIRFIAVYTGLLFLLYSAIPYKTPWCAVGILYGAGLLAGAGASTLSARWPVAALATLALAAFVTSGMYADDRRNPWAYAHTLRDARVVPDRLRQFDATTPIDIYTSQNLWPLPWYLRRRPNVRWWTRVPPDGRPAAPIVIVTPDAEPDLVRKLYEIPPPGRRELYVELFAIDLRPGIAVRGYAAKSLVDGQ